MTTTSRAKGGSGSIRKRPSTVAGRPATYTAVWSVNDPATGHRVQQSKGGFTKQRDAQTYLRERMTEVADGSRPTRAKAAWTVADMMEAWLTAREISPIKPSTMAGYRIAVATWVTPKMGGVKLADMTVEDVNSWLADLGKTGSRTGGPLSSRSVQSAGTVLRMASRWAVKVGRLRRSVAADAEMPKPDESGKLHYWQPEDAAKFAVHVASDRLGCLYLLGLARGMRRGELCGLRWDNVNLAGGYLTVSESRIIVGGTSIQTSTTKTPAGRRQVPLDARLVSILTAHRTRQKAERLAAGAGWTDSGYCFTMEDGTPVKPDHVSDKFRRLCRAADVPAISLHGLRHGVATYLLQAGVSVRVVADILGHSDVSVTLNVYSHVMPGAGHAAGEALSTALGI